MNSVILPWKECSSSFANPDFKIESHLNEKIGGMVTAGLSLKADCQRCLILISRLPHKVSAEEPWLDAVRRAAAFAVENNWTIISSAGSLGWDYISWYAGRLGANVWIVLPSMTASEFTKECERLLIRLRLNQGRTSLLMPLIEGKLKKTDRLGIRDQLCLSFSSHRLPVYLRKKGNWESLIERTEEVDRRFQVDSAGNCVESWRKEKSWMALTVNKQWEDYLIHWTRGIYGAWKGEIEADYFEALTSAHSGNPRDGFATLDHIAGTGILRGEGRMIRDGVPVISFSSLSPVEAMKKIEFRSTLGRWSFEPYGIALPRETLERLGTKRVIYGDKELFNRLSPEDRPFYQYQGSGKPVDKPSCAEDMKTGAKNWREEDEWRIAGDIDLMSLKDELILITPTEEEAKRMRELQTYRICSLERGLNEG